MDLSQKQRSNEKEIKLKEEGIKMDRKVTEVLPNAMFRRCNCYK